VVAVNDEMADLALAVAAKTLFSASAVSAAVVL